MEFVRNFSDLGKDDSAIAGGKGASLGEMTKSGIPVPPGFVILAKAFEKFVKENDLSPEIDSALHSVNHKEVHTVENASEKIQATILRGKIPRDIELHIRNCFKKLNSKFVAVRSSATAEDSASAAWAGQLESFLNTTDKNLLENVKRCWASLFTPRAIFYRFEKGLHDQKISVAVVVQKMVQSKVSGIAFSVHPVTQDRNQIIIEAGLGLGEAIVSGQITPDSYVVEKSGWKIFEKNIAKQSRGIFRSEGGGSEWRDIGSIGEEQKLSDKEIIELSKLVAKIEQHYGFPVDIEWAQEKGRFYIVQSRPITTLAKPVKEKRLFKKLFNRPISLLSAEIWYRGENVGIKNATEGAVHLNPLMIYKKGKGADIYFDFNNPETDISLLFAYFRKNPKRFSDLAGEHIKNIEKLQRLIKNSSPEDFSKIFDIACSLHRMMTFSFILSSLGEYKISKSVFDLAYKTREETDKFESLAIGALNKLIPRIMHNIGNSADFLTFEEIKSKKIPSQKEINSRRGGYIFFENKIYPPSEMKNFVRLKNIEFVKEYDNRKNQIEIRGSTAMRGKAVGKVRVIFEKSEVKFFKEGEVLVTPMTTPEFISAARRACAIITDEGGITCHAAIVARELGKPCIIGTMIATKVLKNGNVVEVDADKGIIKIIKASKK